MGLAQLQNDTIEAYLLLVELCFPLHPLSLALLWFFLHPRV